MPLYYTVGCLSPTFTIYIQQFIFLPIALITFDSRYRMPCISQWKTYVFIVQPIDPIRNHIPKIPDTFKNETNWEIVVHGIETKVYHNLSQFQQFEFTNDLLTVNMCPSIGMFFIGLIIAMQNCIWIRSTIEITHFSKESLYIPRLIEFRWKPRESRFLKLLSF